MTEPKRKIAVHTEGEHKNTVTYNRFLLVHISSPLTASWVCMLLLLLLFPPARLHLFLADPSTKQASVEKQSMPSFNLQEKMIRNNEIFEYTESSQKTVISGES